MSELVKHSTQASVKVPTVSKTRFGELMVAARAVIELHIENLHSQLANTAAHLESTNLIDCKSTPVCEGIQNLDSECGLTNLTGTGTSYVMPGKVKRTPVLFLLDTGLPSMFSRRGSSNNCFQLSSRHSHLLKSLEHWQMAQNCKS